MLPKIIPDKLPGTVIPQYVRCGKINCKCSRGELHGPYWYRFWRDDPYVLHKEYVRKADLEQVRAACEAYAQQVREGRALIKVGRGIADRLSRYDNGDLAHLYRLADTTAALSLLEDLDDYFWEQKGTLKQRLDMFLMGEDFYHLVCGPRADEARRVVPSGQVNVAISPTRLLQSDYRPSRPDSVNISGAAGAG